MAGQVQDLEPTVPEIENISLLDDAGRPGGPAAKSLTS
jgi:hypothetical protein